MALAALAASQPAADSQSGWEALVLLYGWYGQPIGMCRWQCAECSAVCLHGSGCTGVYSPGPLPPIGGRSVGVCYCEG